MPVPGRSGGLHCHERHPQHERAGVLVGELASDDLPSRHGVPAQPAGPVGLAGKGGLGRLAESQRGVPGAAEIGRDPAVTCHHPPVGVGVPGAELRELGAGPFLVAPHRQPRSVAERQVRDRVGMQVLEAVVGQADFVAGEHGAGLDQVVRGRAGIVHEAGQGQLLRACVPADILPCLEQQAG
jgi:hypothetical protein